MYDDLIKRVSALGYTPGADDDVEMRYAVDRAEWEIKSNVNLPAVPDGLRLVWIDMAAGLFLRDRKAAGRLPIQFETPAKSIAEGDTTVTFAGGGSDGALTPEAQFDRLLSGLIKPPQEQLAAYRRMKR